MSVTPAVLDNYEGHENDIAVKFAIDEGTQMRVGAFHMVGNSTFSASGLGALSQHGRGASLFRSITSREDRDTILNYYFNRGFPDATFEAAANPMPSHTDRMDVIYTIHEGKQVFVDQVLVSGLVHTKPFIVNRELQVASGDPLSQIDMLKTQQKLYDLGIFNQVDIAVENPSRK